MLIQNRKPFLAGNWKMNNTLAESVVLAQEISNRYDKEWPELIDIAVIPPYVSIKPVKTVFDFDRAKITVGAQNVFYEKSGAYTGEISAPMLKELGATYCIVGHSERRNLFGETNEDVNKKVHALLGEHLSPIICVGESLAVRESGKALEYVVAQVRAAFAGVYYNDAKICTVAYEPVWAIGTGRTATPEVAQEICAAIRQELSALYSTDIAQDIRILYGGSMNAGNAKMLMAEPDIDGGLIGSASLSAVSFVDLIDICSGLEG